MSEPVRRLEQEHNVTLFQRGSRTLVLTAAGELLPYAEQSIAAADDGSRALRSGAVDDWRRRDARSPRDADYYLLCGLVAGTLRCWRPTMTVDAGKVTGLIDEGMARAGS